MSILILDIGTTSMRGILYDLHGHRLAMHRCANHPQFLEDGEVDESPRDWSDNTEQIIRAITSAGGVENTDIQAVAITSQRSSIIPVNRKGEPLMDTIMWQDVRNCDICGKLSKFNDLSFKHTGAKVNAVFSGSKMTWVRRNCPEIYANTYKFVNIPEYVYHLMTGSFRSDYTYASRSGLFNIHTREWDPELLRLYEVEPEKLCELSEPGTVIRGRNPGLSSGCVSEEYAKKTGLPAGIPVIHAGGDQQCAAVGQGVTHSGNISIIAGTGGFIMGALDRIPENLHDNVICNCSAIAGKYVIESNILACSSAFDWFAKQIYGMDKIDYVTTENELASETDVTNCLVVPYFRGKGAPGWDPDARAVFADITLATRRSEMFKSMMESVFMELGNHLNDFSDYMTIDEIFISGGMTTSRTLNQLQADVYGRSVIAREDKESTAYGAYLVALTGLGYYSDVDEAFSSLRGEDKETVYEPDIEKHEKYVQKQSRMNELYRKVSGK